MEKNTMNTHEIFYRYGFEVPRPQYYEDAARATFLGIRNVSDLPERERDAVIVFGGFIC